MNNLSSRIRNTKVKYLIKEGTHYYVAQQLEDYLLLLDSIQKYPKLLTDITKFWSNLEKIPAIYIDVYEVIAFESNSSIEISVTHAGIF